MSAWPARPWRRKARAAVRCRLRGAAHGRFGRGDLGRHGSSDGRSLIDGQFVVINRLTTFAGIFAGKEATTAKGRDLQSMILDHLGRFGQAEFRQNIAPDRDVLDPSSRKMLTTFQQRPGLGRHCVDTKSG